MTDIQTADGGADEVEFVADEESTNIDTRARIKKLRDELARAEAERKEYLDGWQRSKADFINYKKDESKRLEDMVRFVSAGLVEDMLPVLDSFDLSLGHTAASEVEKGVLMIRLQLLDVLKRRGLEPMDVTIGAPLDTAYHESVGEIEGDGPEGVITEIIQKGYMFQGKVLRPARVRVSVKKLQA